jgi:hypothetical protein|uniref:Endonuclease n=1 Tax=Siphoviridae sp. ctqwY3 TaxID=2827951 RepID=A0A8S5S6N6_9CAUD|nr:MAG TPA: endonuclease [Siphoviridae sp. ctqwY3]
MSKRSQWCEFDKDTRKYIKKRDNNECVVCHSKGALQIMHIFLSRAKGGRGSKENGCLGCVKCHKIIDNPLFQEQILKQPVYIKKCSDYLIEKEHIKYGKEFIDSLKFDKEKYYNTTMGQRDLANIMVKGLDKGIKKEYVTRCKDCALLVKDKNNSNSIPRYFCKYKKTFLNKSTKACGKFRGK